MLIKKSFGWTLSKKFYFFNFKFAEAKFLHNCFWYNLLCTTVFGTDTSKNRKVVDFTYNAFIPGLSKRKLLSNY